MNGIITPLPNAPYYYYYVGKCCCINCLDQYSFEYANSCDYERANILKEVAAAWSKVLFQNLPGGTEENQENLGYLISEPRIKAVKSQIRSRIHDY
jgi:hypothetical protein